MAMTENLPKEAKKGLRTLPFRRLKTLPGNVQKIVPDRAETLDFPFSKLRFAQNSNDSRFHLNIKAYVELSLVCNTECNIDR